MFLYFELDCLEGFVDDLVIVRIHSLFLAMGVQLNKRIYMSTFTGGANCLLKFIYKAIQFI